MTFAELKQFFKKKFCRKEVTVENFDELPLDNVDKVVDNGENLLFDDRFEEEFNVNFLKKYPLTRSKPMPKAFDGIFIEC